MMNLPAAVSSWRTDSFIERAGKVGPSSPAYEPIEDYIDVAFGNARPLVSHAQSGVQELLTTSEQGTAWVPDTVAVPLTSEMRIVPASIPIS
jgi:hypothetical protein